MSPSRPDRTGVPRTRRPANPAARSLAGLTGRPSLRDRGRCLAAASAGHTAGMVDEVWLEAAAAVSADAAAELRADAAEVFAAEAARTRLVDLRGSVRIRLRCGESVEGTVVTDDPVDARLVLTAAPSSGSLEGGRPRCLLVPTDAVLQIDGSSIALRQEAVTRVPRTLGSWLRERWADGDVVRVLDRSGVVQTGALTFVGADHVRLDSGRCVAWAAVDAWST